MLTKDILIVCLLIGQVDPVFYVNPVYEINNAVVGEGSKARQSAAILVSLMMCLCLEYFLLSGKLQSSLQ